MTLRFDGNLSPVLVRDLADSFVSTHVRDVGLSRASDTAVWSYARDHGLLIVSKDSDFHQRSLLLAAPPKVIWIRRGNCPSHVIAALLREAAGRIAGFVAEPIESLLVLD